MGHGRSGRGRSRAPRRRRPRAPRGARPSGRVISPAVSTEPSTARAPASASGAAGLSHVPASGEGSGPRRSRSPPGSTSSRRHSPSLPIRRPRRRTPSGHDGSAPRLASSTLSMPQVRSRSRLSSDGNSLNTCRAGEYQAGSSPVRPATMGRPCDGCQSMRWMEAIRPHSSNGSSRRPPLRSERCSSSYGSGGGGANALRVSACTRSARATRRTTAARAGPSARGRPRSRSSSASVAATTAAHPAGRRKRLSSLISRSGANTDERGPKIPSRRGSP